MPKVVYLVENKKLFDTMLSDISRYTFAGVKRDLSAAYQLAAQDYPDTPAEKQKQAYAIYVLEEQLREYAHVHDKKQDWSVYQAYLDQLKVEAKKLSNKELMSYLQFILVNKRSQVLDQDQNNEVLEEDITKLDGGRVAKIDLFKAPNPMPYITEQNWLSFGDMHGNALKLLHIIMMTGAGQLPNNNKDQLYKQFLSIYYMTEFDWSMRSDEEAKHLIAMMDEVIDQLVLSGQVNLRLIGDLICDRGANDYFTLRLLEKLVEKNPSAIEIILSNHDVEAIERHFNGKITGVEKYSDDNYFRYKGSGQTQSMAGMHYFLKRNLISQARVDQMFHHYGRVLQLASYDKSPDKNRLMIHSHAPINPVNILMAGMCLIDPQNQQKTQLLIDDNEKAILTKILEKAQTGKSLVNGDLVLIIDVLNNAAQNAIEKHTLTDFLDLRIQSDYFITRPNQAPEKMVFSDTRECGTTVGPIRFFFESRDNPNLTMKVSNIDVSQCDMCCTHGHIGTDKRSYFKNCLNIDSDSGKYLGDEQDPLPFCFTNKMSPQERIALEQNASAQYGLTF